MHFVVQVSPNHKLFAYAEDTKGDEIYIVYVIDAETRAPVGKPLEGVTSDFQWAGNETLVYITMNEILRRDKVWVSSFHALKFKTYSIPTKDSSLFLAS